MCPLRAEDPFEKTPKTVAVPREESVAESFREDKISGATSRQRKRSQGTVNSRQKSGRKSIGRRGGINPVLIIGAAAAVFILAIAIFAVTGLVKRNSKTEASEANEEEDASENNGRHS